jgi:branched-chain amino acid transport system substrate-binding protein
MIEQISKITLAALIALPTFALAETGVTANSIAIGSALPLSGPTKDLGLGVRRGYEAYVNKVNKQGGIHGRVINLVVKDDGYEPDQTLQHTKDLIAKEKVFALFNYVGTPTSKAAVPEASSNKVPYLFPFTGAEFLRAPINRFVFNIRASYFDETEALVEHFVKDLKITKIGIFIQDDGYGEAGKAGVVRALRKRGLDIVGEARYKRNTEEVAEGLAALKKAGPQAIILVGAYKPCAKFIKEAVASGFKPKFANISFVGSESLVAEMGAAGVGSYISQVLPSPTTSALAIAKQYRDDMTAAGHKNFEYTSFEGYVNAVLLVEVLKKAGKELTREKFISTLESMNQDLGGITVQFSANSHQGLQRVYLTQVADGQAVEVEKMK